jgi:hypothetical protein
VLIQFADPLNRLNGKLGPRVADGRHRLAQAEFGKAVTFGRVFQVIGRHAGACLTCPCEAPLAPHGTAARAPKLIIRYVAYQRPPLCF